MLPGPVGAQHVQGLVRHMCLRVEAVGDHLGEELKITLSGRSEGQIDGQNIQPKKSLLETCPPSPRG